jgi:predicted nucleic acid-binding protein
MKYVLDSSVAVKWVLLEVDTAIAHRLRADSRAGAHELIAPDVFPVESAHALTRAERQGRVTPQGGWALWQIVMADCPTLHPYMPLIPRAYEFSSRHRIGVYDCLYVALAEREGCELVTADTRLVTTLSPTFPYITPLSALP